MLNEFFLFLPVFPADGASDGGKQIETLSLLWGQNLHLSLRLFYHLGDGHRFSLFFRIIFFVGTLLGSQVLLMERIPSRLARR